MIISASRRTDIPALYFDWFLNRLEAGYLKTRNPVQNNIVYNVSLNKDVIDCIVFWTKNTTTISKKDIERLNSYQIPYYFQYTLTGYGTSIEPNIPHKSKVMIDEVKRLSSYIGSNKVIWRYDPIFFTHLFTPDYHLRAFATIAKELKGFTNKCVISLVDVYPKIKSTLQSLGTMVLSENDLNIFLNELVSIANKNNIELCSCATNLNHEGIKANSCIDKELIESIIGYKIGVTKDKSQRKECGCISSIDIGTYNTCTNGCLYCYANKNKELTLSNNKKYDPNSTILCDYIKSTDIIMNRKMQTLRI